MKQIPKNINWNATAFFERLASCNILAKTEGFRFCRVSGLEGFEECIHSLQSTANFIAVSDIAQGFTELNTTPHTRRVKTVFFAMRHAIDDMDARQQCMDIMRELFRQFMSVLIQEKTRVEEEHIYLDPRISFQEIDRYFLSGCACAFFQVATDVYTDLRYNSAEWEESIVAGHEVYYTKFYNNTYKNYSISFLSSYLEITKEKATQMINNYPSVIVSTKDYPEDVVSQVYTVLKNNKCTVLYRDIIEENEVCRL